MQESKFPRRLGYRMVVPKGKIHCVGRAEYERRYHQLNKNFFLVPNAVYQMDLTAGAKQIYTYLCYCENRKTYQCHPSYKTIGKNVGMSVNTVRKYITELVEKKLITTENTHRFNVEGQKQNSVLRYTLLPIQNAIDSYHERQITELQHTIDIQDAKVQAERLGVNFVPATERTA